ncbi:hypothetical protein FQZ97_854520 [compost metagenome]
MPTAIMPRRGRKLPASTTVAIMAITALLRTLPSSAVASVVPSSMLPISAWATSRIRPWRNGSHSAQRTTESSAITTTTRDAPSRRNTAAAIEGAATHRVSSSACTACCWWRSIAPVCPGASGSSVKLVFSMWGGGYAVVAGGGGEGARTGTSLGASVKENTAP